MKEVGARVNAVTPESGKAKARAHSHEIFWVFAQGHVHDVQRVVVVLLCGQQEGQQVQGIGVIALQLQRLAHVPQRLRDLVGNTTRTDF